MNKRRTWIGIALVALVAVAFWVFQSQGRLIEVTVEEAKVGTIVSPFTAEAIVKGETVEIEPETSGRIVEVLVREGSAVAKGQPLVRLSSSELDSVVEQALHSLAAAKDKVEEAEHLVGLTSNQVEARIDEARAANRVAEARLDAIMAGQRPEEIAQAEQRLRQAESVERQAKADLDRAKRLFEEGAIPRSQFERAATAYESAQAETKIAREVLTLMRKGATAEEREAARAQVSATKAALDSAIAGREQIDVTEHELAAAQSAERQAAAQLAAADASRNKATVSAPFAGTVSYIPVKVGELAAPGRSLLTLVGNGATTIEAEVGDQDFSKVSVGQRVDVTSASFPGRKFAGSVTRIAEEAVQKPGTLLRTRVLRATIVMDSDGAQFRPGMEVDVHGEGTVAERALTIPSRALVTSGDSQSVWLFVGGAVRSVPVKTGAYTFESVQVTEGLKSGDLVVVAPPTGLKDGQRVRRKGG
jgi:HlyD family secretion protein